MVTEYRNVYIPETMLVDCSKTAWNGGTYRGLAALAKSRGTDVDNCNAQLRAARDYQRDLKAKEQTGLDGKSGM